MKRNIHELPQIIELAGELNCQGVACSHLNVNSPELIEESLFFHKEECNYFLDKAKDIAQRRSISLIAPSPFINCSNGNNTKGDHPEAWRICRFLWNYVIIGMNGKFSCCGGLDYDFEGDVTKNRFIDIWNNDWFATMRYRLLTGDPPDECKNCRDSCGKDVNNIGSLFSKDMLPEALSYIQ